MNRPVVIALAGDAGGAAAVVETLKTARYLVWARWAETCNP